MTLKLNADRQNADFNPIPFSLFSDFRSFLQNLSLTNQISANHPHRICEEKRISQFTVLRGNVVSQNDTTGIAAKQRKCVEIGAFEPFWGPR